LLSSKGIGYIDCSTYKGVHIDFRVNCQGQLDDDYEGKNIITDVATTETLKILIILLTKMMLLYVIFIY